MILLDPAPRLPFMDPRTLRMPGLLPFDPADWATLDPDFAAQMPRREELLAAKPDLVLAMTPEGAGPARELLAELTASAIASGHWREAGPDRITRPDGVKIALDPDRPMETIGRLFQDDFCLLVPDPEGGEYRLAAAVLCFPSRWLLPEKVGKPLTAIHDPVPDYDEALARRVNRVFDALQIGRPVWRANWVVHPTPELHLPLGLTDKLMQTAEDSGGPLYLRTERQTLTRLPRSSAVAFGIKVSVTPLDALGRQDAAAMHAALRGLDEATIDYRSGAAVTRRALAILAEIAGQDRVADAS